MTILQPILDLLRRFDDNAPQYRSPAYNETEARREFIDPLFKALGWDVDNTQGYSEKYKEVVHEARVTVGGRLKAPDYAFRVGGRPVFFVEAKRPGVTLTPFFWEEEQTPHFLEEQCAYLTKALECHPDRRHLLCTHSEVLGVPPEQTGLAGPIRVPLAAFMQMILDLTRTYPQLDGVLSAHNHINTLSVQGNAHLITVSALTETPFEFKVFTVTTTEFTMETVNLLPAVEFKAAYNFDKTYVQGRRRDRAFGV